MVGELPERLRGRFARDGPNQMFEPIGKYHIFDGDGMLDGVDFDGGRAVYRNRWVRSWGLEAEIALGRSVYPGLSDLMNFPDRSLAGDAGPVKDRANTHIIRGSISMPARRVGSTSTTTCSGKMCRINDDRTGLRTDCLYMSAFTRAGATAGDFVTIVTYDTAADTRSIWYVGDSGHLDENVFAPDPAGTAEDDGWILNSCHDSDTGVSEVLVLDAPDIAAGPVARVRIPQRLPFGFHANWFPAD